MRICLVATLVLVLHLEATAAPITFASIGSFTGVMEGPEMGFMGDVSPPTSSWTLVGSGETPPGPFQSWADWNLSNVAGPTSISGTGRANMTLLVEPEVASPVGITTNLFYTASFDLTRPAAFVWNAYVGGMSFDTGVVHIFSQFTGPTGTIAEAFNSPSSPTGSAHAEGVLDPGHYVFFVDAEGFALVYGEWNLPPQSLLSFYAVDLTLTEVPEPASFLILGSGFAVALLRRRRSCQYTKDH